MIMLEMAAGTVFWDTVGEAGQGPLPEQTPSDLWEHLCRGPRGKAPDSGRQTKASDSLTQRMMHPEEAALGLT